MHSSQEAEITCNVLDPSGLANTDGNASAPSDRANTSDNAFGPNGRANTDAKKRPLEDQDQP